jgi:hypothetical protein
MDCRFAGLPDCRIAHSKTRGQCHAPKHVYREARHPSDSWDPAPLPLQQTKKAQFQVSPE